MRMSSRHTSILVYFTPGEAAEMEKHYGRDTMFTLATYEPDHNRFLMRRSKQGEPASRVRPNAHKRRGEQIYAASWPFNSPTGVKAGIPMFEVTDVIYEFAEHGLLITVPPPEKRVEPMRIYHSRRQKNVEPTLSLPAPSKQAENGAARRVDMLDAIRHHLGKLNERKRQHPNDITFRVNAEGLLTVELLTVLEA